MKELLKTEVPTKTTTPLIAYAYEVHTAKYPYTFYFRKEIPAVPIIDAFLGVRWLVEETNMYQEEVEAEDFCDDADDFNTFKEYGVLVKTSRVTSKYDKEYGFVFKISRATCKYDTEEVFNILERNKIEKLKKIDELYNKYLRKVMSM